MTNKTKKTTRIPSKNLVKKEDGAKLAKSEAQPIVPDNSLKLKALNEWTGAKSSEVAYAILTQACGLQFDSGTTSEKTDIAMKSVKEMAPGNLTEAMLAVQMIGVHNVAVRFLQLSLVPNQTLGGADLCIARASKLLRLFTEQLGAMAKLKGKAGQQRMTVEHVHIHAGGQAIVGPVGPRSGTPAGTGEGK